ncbi:MAG: hypothetical protein IPI67_18940 [Myxococcales bacterium]|nr:hypothetical protein [Myxococcales bacterium]
MPATPADPRTVASELRSHPTLDALVEAVRGARAAAVASADRAFPRAEIALERAPSDTPFGNLAEVFERGPRTEAEAALVAVLLVLGVVADFPSAPETERARAQELAWLAANTRVNPLLAVDAVLDDERSLVLWRALASLAEPSVADDPGVALAALAALAASNSDRARVARLELSERSRDPLVRALLSSGAAADGARLEGELSPAPRGIFGTVVLALTGLLLVSRGARLLGRLALAFRQPADVRVSERGLELSHRTELLGRVLRKREILIPMANLARVTREIRFPRLGLYLGLGALAFGSYVGMGLFVDGARVPGGSAPLLGMGLLIIVLGLAVDYGLSMLFDNVRGRCRLLVEPKKGRRICIGALDPERADAMLSQLAAHLKR